MTARAGSGRRYRVGVVADTHVGDALPALPAGVGRALAGVDLVIHAGDLTTAAVLDELAGIAPVVAVRGNNDPRAGIALPRTLIVRIGGARIGVTHGDRGPLAEAAWGLAGVAVGRPVLAGVPRALAGRFADVDCVVFGHFHVPFIGRAGAVTVFSPGSVYVVEADPALGPPRGLKDRAYRRYRRGLPAEARRPQVGVLEVADGIVVPRFVPVEGPLRAGAASRPPGR